MQLCARKPLSQWSPMAKFESNWQKKKKKKLHPFLDGILKLILHLEDIFSLR